MNNVIYNKVPHRNASLVVVNNGEVKTVPAAVGYAVSQSAETKKVGDESAQNASGASTKTARKSKVKSVQKKQLTAGVPDHDKFDKLLKKYVSDSGRVNYEGLKSEAAVLKKYLKKLSNHPPQSSWSRNEKLAYWINAYNAFTLELILNNYPLQSIKELDGGNPWEVKRIKIGDRKYSLNQIENEIIRPRFNEPRIHFAVNCAAVSCPPLLNAAYTPDRLNQQLEWQTRKFINNDKFNQISSSQAQVSKVFDWYRRDFGDLKSFLNAYSDTKLKPDAAITYRAYNWDLNK